MIGSVQPAKSFLEMVLLEVGSGGGEEGEPLAWTGDSSREAARSKEERGDFWIENDGGGRSKVTGKAMMRIEGEEMG